MIIGWMGWGCGFFPPVVRGMRVWFCATLGSRARLADRDGDVEGKRGGFSATLQDKL